MQYRLLANAPADRDYSYLPQTVSCRVFQTVLRPVTRFDTEIVGVVGDTKHANLRDPSKRTVYRPLLQSPQLNSLTYLVRTWQEPKTAEANLRSALQGMDSKLALSHLQTEDEQIAMDLSTERLIALLSVSFGIVAVLLAAMGLYGVLAYSTAQRTREIGIRMAMGARRSSVVQLVLEDVLWICGVSVVVTIPVALLLGRLLQQQLFGIGASDPLTLFGGTLLVAVVALLAAMVPARRAASVEPMQALRTE